MSSRAERNKELAVDCFTKFAAGNLDVLHTLLREDFVEHSPGNPSGRDAFVEFIANSPIAKAELDLHKVIADDDHVVMHYRMTMPDDERGHAVVDIWRFEGDQIVEHWDVVQPVPEDAQMF
jgi:predicted SnoaL-like aldol condensation-catalyzing enzyme